MHPSITARSQAAGGWQAALAPPQKRHWKWPVGATDQPPLLTAVESVEIKSVKTGIYMVCWRRQHSFCKEKFCLVDLLELWVHVIRARREDPAGVAQSRFENGSDKIPHQKLSRNRTCHRMGEKTHRKLEAGQNSQFQSPKVVLQRGWLLPWQGWDISIHAEGHCQKVH